METKLLRQLLHDSTRVGPDDYADYLAQIEQGRVSAAEIVAFLTALSTKPLQTYDVLQFLRYLRATQAPLVLRGAPAVNIVGTGGGPATFNISTTASLVASAAGVRVIKSGSRAYKSVSGALDAVEGLGLRTVDSPAEVEAMLNAVGIAFTGVGVYPKLPLKIAKTIFPLSLRTIGGFINKIGPLLCPFALRGQLTGVSNERDMAVLREAACELGLQRYWFAHCRNGMDELASVADALLVSTHSDKGTVEPLSPQVLGLHSGALETLLVGSKADSRAMVEAVLVGVAPRAAIETVALNAAFVAWIASGESIVLRAEIARMIELIRDGHVHQHLLRLRAFPQVDAPAAATR
ncbi:MAG: hypothetical protein HY308_00640 [Gammaproteobacteria bacterium]|nr:hypothetical protein [Gammaproteobacteria bacterium]